MDHFKIEHFERNRPGETFPRFEPLVLNELHRIRKGLAHLVGDDGTVEPLKLIRDLLAKSVPVDDFDATSEEFDLLAVTESLGLKPRPEIFINWDRLETVDRMRFTDLSKYFDDIWYPSADDIEIFDDTLSWVLFVNHSGSISIIWSQWPLR